MTDAEARRRIREDLDATLVVEASAGTGKTTELIHRILGLVRTGRARLPGLVAVTFTEKAAGELKLRLRTGLEKAHAAASGEERARLAQATAELEAAQVSTLHAFAAQLLRERPVEARVDPAFETLDEDGQRRLFGEAFDTWFARTLESPPPGVRRLLRRRPRRFGDASPRDLLQGAAVALAEHRDFATAWRRDPFDRERELDELVAELGELGEMAAQARDPDDYLARNLAAVGRFASELLRREEARGGRDHDGLEAELGFLARERSWTWKGSMGRFGPGRTKALERRDALFLRLQDFLRRAEADLAALLSGELRELLVDYAERKRRAGALDFLDLLLGACGLLRGDRAARAELQLRFTHLLVDEFQDTDPLQAELLLLLAANDPAQGDWTKVQVEPGKLFVVGDPKQAIYRFRRADLGIYEQVKRQLQAGGGSLVELQTSFRAVPEIQALVNAAFEPAFLAGEKQAPWGPLRPHRAATPQQPAIVALPAPRPYGDREVVRWKVEESLPGAVAGFVEWLVNRSGWKVAEGKALVPVRPKHVAILLRRFTAFREDVTAGYVTALEAHRVPHVLVGGRSFHAREEALALLATLRAIEWPSDELSVFATLRGPFLALGDDVLLAFRARHGAPHPLRRLDALDPALREVGDALHLLARLHHARNRRPVAETLREFLHHTCGLTQLALWPAGEQALSSVERLLELARGFEAQGATSFRAFVERVADEAERGRVVESVALEEGAEGVRILTVHRAKGLEFPVVVLAEPTAPAIHERPSRHVDAARGLWVEPLAGCVPAELHEHAAAELARDAEEAQRLAYVAATRARDLLVLPVCGDSQLPGWLSALNPALYPEDGARRRPAAAPLCPVFGGDSVLARPEEAAHLSASSVAPGLHRPQKGAHGVVWWDPALLDGGGEAPAGLRLQAALEPGAGADRSLREQASWSAKREATLARGARPGLAVMTIGEAAAAVEKPPTGVAVERTTVDRDRPAGPRFGTLVHAVLARIELGAGAADCLAAAAFEGRLLGATTEEVQAAAAAVAAALGHPLLRRAATSRDLRREVWVSQPLPEGARLEGQLDLAFREPAGFTVVEFKTDPEASAAHLEQARLYAQAVAEASGAPAVGVVLLV
jgi:ATP-dependent exoDNAse (exonuclease V) beta subunit